MLKNIFVKEKKYLHIAFVNAPALCNLASDLAHNVFIILYYEQCRVKRCCKCTFFLEKKQKNQIFNSNFGGGFCMYELFGCIFYCAYGM